MTANFSKYNLVLTVLLIYESARNAKIHMQRMCVCSEDLIKAEMECCFFHFHHSCNSEHYAQSPPLLHLLIIVV